VADAPSWVCILAALCLRSSVWSCDAAHVRARGATQSARGHGRRGAPRRRLVPVAVARGGVIVGFIVLTIAAIGVYAVVGAARRHAAPPLHSLVWLAPRRHRRRRLLCAGSSQALLSTTPCRAQDCWWLAAAPCRCSPPG